MIKKLLNKPDCNLISEELGVIMTVELPCGFDTTVSIKNKSYNNQYVSVTVYDWNNKNEQGESTCEIVFSRDYSADNIGSARWDLLKESKAWTY